MLFYLEKPNEWSTKGGAKLMKEVAHFNGQFSFITRKRKKKKGILPKDL